MYIFFSHRGKTGRIDFPEERAPASESKRVFTSPPNFTEFHRMERWKIHGQFSCAHADVLKINILNDLSTCRRRAIDFKGAYHLRSKYAQKQWARFLNV